MKSFLMLFFIACLLLCTNILCDLGLDIKDPLADRGAFDITMTNWYSEVRTVAGRPVTVKIRQDTVYGGDDVIYRYSGGVMDVVMKNEAYGVMLRFVGGIEGTALRGEYALIPYDGSAPVQQDKFYSSAETKSADRTMQYLSEEGTVSIAMYRPQKRLGANFKFRARALSEGGNEAKPDSVTFIGGFNAMFQKEE